MQFLPIEHLAVLSRELVQMFSAPPCSIFSPMDPRDNRIVERGPERSLQMVLRPFLEVDRALQSAYQIKYDIDDLEDVLEDLPMQHQAMNVAALKRLMSTVVAALEMEKLQCLLRLRQDLLWHRNVHGRIPAIGLR